MAYKKPRFLTPNEPQEDSPTIVRTIFLPSEPEEIQALVDGAISLLFEDDNWLKNGEMTEAETAQYYRNLNIMATTFCQAMINCILTDDDVRQALYDAMVAGGFSPSGASDTNTGEAIPSITEREVFEDCDEENLYGASLKIVEAMDRLTNDILEFVEIFTNFLEAQSKFLEKIPVIGLLGSIPETIDFFFECLTEIYNAVYTLPVQEAIACEIYCRALDNDCTITMQIIREAYSEFVSSDITLNISGDLQDFIDSILAVPLTVDAFWVGVIHSAWQEIFARGGEINGLTWRYIELAMDSFTPATPLCEDCACANPIRNWNWQDMTDVTIYPITDRLITSGYPFFSRGTHSYAVGSLETGELPQDIGGFEADCEFNWIDMQLFYIQSSGSSTKTATIAVYSDSAHTTLIDSFTVEVPHNTIVNVHQQLSVPITGQDTYYIVVSIPPHTSGYGFYQSDTSMSVEEL